MAESQTIEMAETASEEKTNMAPLFPEETVSESELRGEGRQACNHRSLAACPWRQGGYQGPGNRLYHSGTDQPPWLN
jgi:hypothetical protein